MAMRCPRARAITSSVRPAAQPPWLKPPRVSSSGRPGDCITPSRVMWLITTSLIDTTCAYHSDDADTPPALVLSGSHLERQRVAATSGDDELPEGSKAVPSDHAKPARLLHQPARWSGVPRSASQAEHATILVTRSLRRGLAD